MEPVHEVFCEHAGPCGQVMHCVQSCM